MTPGARLQAAIELLAAIREGQSPADRTAAAFFRARRYMGGQDRREVVDRAYAVLRRQSALDWWIAHVSPERPANRERARMIAALALIDRWTADKIAGSFDGGQYRPAPLEAEEKRLTKALVGQVLGQAEQPRPVRLEFPAWLEPALEEALGDELDPEMAALMGAAATDLRANTLNATRDEALTALAREGVEGRATPLSPVGIRVDGRPPLAGLQCFKAGLIEVQDEGSQLVALLTDARPGARVVDFCAGAGGKTLALAATMKNKGKLVATDVLEGRVARAATRLSRAGVHNVERRGLVSERDPWVKRHLAKFDRVLIDAPCSGSGTWRRNPDAKWRLKPEDIGELAALQRRILASAARLVKPGGRLIYATCSLLGRENQDQIEWFLAEHPDFAILPMADVWGEVLGGELPSPGPYLRLSPARHGTDGFFLAVLAKAKPTPKPEPEPETEAEPEPEEAAQPEMVEA